MPILIILKRISMVMGGSQVIIPCIASDIHSHLIERVSIVERVPIGSMLFLSLIR